MDGRKKHSEVTYLPIADATSLHPRNDSASIVGHGNVPLEKLDHTLTLAKRFAAFQSYLSFSISGQLEEDHLRVNQLNIVSNYQLWMH